MLKRFYLGTIIAVVCVAPFANDIFSAGLPAIAQEFHNNHTQLIYSCFLFGLALSQLAYGPLLDRFGRKPVLLCGLWLFMLSTIVIVTTDKFHILLLARFFQGVGACSAIVGVMAIVRDLFDRDDMVRMMSVVMAVIGISPVLAPLIGSTLIHIWNWQASFYLLIIMGIFFLVFYHFIFKETLKEKNHNAMHINHIVANYTQLFKNHLFTRYCIASACSYASLFAFLSISPFFIIHQLGYSVVHFGIIMAIDAIAIVAMTYCAPRLVKKYSIDWVIVLGLILIGVGGLLLFILTHIFGFNIYVFMLPMFITTIGIGLIRPSASGGVMRLSEQHNAGSAAAAFNFCSFMGGSIATTLTATYILNVNAFAMFIIVLAVFALFIKLIPTKKSGDK